MKSVFSRIGAFCSAWYIKGFSLFDNVRNAIRRRYEYWFAPKNLQPVTEVRNFKEFFELWASQRKQLRSLQLGYSYKPGALNDQLHNNEIPKFISRLEECTSLERIRIAYSYTINSIHVYGNSKADYDPKPEYFLRFINALEQNCATITELILSSEVLPNIGGVQEDLPEELDIKEWRMLCEFISKCEKLKSIELQQNAMMRLFKRRPLQNKQLMDTLAACQALETIDFSGNAIFCSWQSNPVEATTANSKAINTSATTDDYWPPLLELFRNPNLKTVILKSMAFYSLTDSQWQELADKVKKHPKLEKLDVSLNNLDSLLASKRKQIQDLFKIDGRNFELILLHPFGERVIDENAPAAPNPNAVTMRNAFLPSGGAAATATASVASAPIADAPGRPRSASKSSTTSIRSQTSAKPSIS